MVNRMLTKSLQKSAVGLAALLSTTFGMMTAMPDAHAQQKVASAQARSGFDGFIQSLWPQAQANGVSRETFNEAFAGVTPDASIIALTKKQSEFSAPIWGYLRSAVSAGRIEKGRAMAAQYADTLARVESQYGVPKEIILAVWGMETNYGAGFGNTYIIRALATLAYASQRREFYTTELIGALRILEEGHISRDNFRGSWAGAMGHTQFMPTSFLKYAVDYNGDGRKDIWRSIPDALASTGNYLAQHGWQRGTPWGVEVEIPDNLDYRTMRRSFSAWATAGVRPATSRGMSFSGEARLYLPAGASGPAFLVTENYDVIKKYNMSDAYAMGVAHLGDRIMGRSAIQGTWPARDPLPSTAQKSEVQRQLARLGLYRDKIDGKIGSGTRDSVRQFQLSQGIHPADGNPTPEVLARLKAAKR
ncbi:MAG: lytic murein transglycosylase [Beijerinckiaceae bacterium]